MVKKIGIIGLGNVGQATVRSLHKFAKLITHRTSLKLEVKEACDFRKARGKALLKYQVPFTTQASKILNDPAIDIVVELVGGLEPSRTYILEALKKGKHVVTANKALLATSGRQIFSLANRMNRRVGFEASVCGAIPLIKSISEGLISCEVEKIYGILNGTTNYILSKMSREKIDFQVALKEAQKKGIAERNPTLDIDGIDTLHKLCILSYLCFGIWPEFSRVHTEGISQISLFDVLYAEELHYSIKLLAIAKKEGKKLELRIHPTLVSIEHPLSKVSNAFNAAFLDTQPAGELLFYGLGAGGVPTSSSVISDIVSIALNEKGFIRKEERMRLKNINEIKTRYYIRFMTQDRPGVLAKIAKILASFDISIASVTQKEPQSRRTVPIVMITHRAREANMQKALNRINQLPVIKSPTRLIRIEDI